MATMTEKENPLATELLYQQILSGIDEVQERMRKLRELAAKIAHVADEETTKNGAD